MGGGECSVNCRGRSSPFMLKNFGSICFHNNVDPNTVIL